MLVAVPEGPQSALHWRSEQYLPDPIQAAEPAPERKPARSMSAPRKLPASAAEYERADQAEQHATEPGKNDQVRRSKAQSRDYADARSSRII